VQDMETLLEEESLQEIKEHEVVKGTVVLVNHNEAFVDIGYKAEIAIPKHELAYPAPESAADVVKEGDVIEVYVVSMGGENGVLLSKVKADKLVSWKEMEGIFERKETVDAKVTQVVKGGLVAAVHGLRGFIPASQMGLRFEKDLSGHVGETVQVLPIEVDIRKQRLVLSRRILLEAERDKKQAEVFACLEEGTIIRGTVKRIVDYGAFVDIGGVDGLAHISDLSWEHVKHPSDVLSVDQEIDVFVKSFDPETKRISLSIKDTVRDPWLDKAERYQEGDHIEGKILKLTDFGAFMEIEPGFDGLIPMGELADKKISKAEEVVHVGDIVKVKILHIDMKKKRISLSIAKAVKDAETAEYTSYLSEQEKAVPTLGDEVGNVLKQG
jgi:ribosomal protein S1